MLEVADYVVLAATLAISSAIGLYYRFTGGRQGFSSSSLRASKTLQNAIDLQNLPPLVFRYKYANSP